VHGHTEFAMVLRKTLPVTGPKRSENRTGDVIESHVYRARWQKFCGWRKGQKTDEQNHTNLYSYESTAPYMYVLPWRTDTAHYVIIYVILDGFVNLKLNIIYKPLINLVLPINYSVRYLNWHCKSGKHVYTTRDKYKLKNVVQ